MVNRNDAAATRPSLEGCELQLPLPKTTGTRHEQQQALGMARLKIRHPPMLFQSAATDVVGDTKYAGAPHLRYLTVEEKLERERLAEAAGRREATPAAQQQQQQQQQQLGYRDLSLALAWPLLACGAVHPDLYRRSVAAASCEDALVAAAAAAEAAATVEAKSHRRRKDPVLMHEERIFNQDRVLRSLERR